MLSDVPCTYSRQLKSGRRHRMPLRSVENNAGLTITSSLSDTPKSSVPFRHEAFTDHYTVEQDIGRGKFAVVRRCRHRLSGQIYAAKFLRRRRGGQDCRDIALHEIGILEQCLQHAHVVSIIEVFESAREIIIVTECAGGGDLMRCIEEGAVDETVAVHVVRQVLQALSYLHSYNLVHLDLKPQNILLSEPAPLEARIMLCDLGVVRKVNGEEEVRDIVGTPHYVAPEVLAYDPIQTATDMWGVGVLAYELLTGFSPFAGETKQETFCNISQVDVDYSSELFGSHISEDAVDFMQCLLKRDPRERLSAEEAQSHSWLRGPQDSLATPPLTTPALCSSSSPAGQRRALASPPPSTEPLKRCRCHSPLPSDCTTDRISLPENDAKPILLVTPDKACKATSTLSEATPTSSEAKPIFGEATPSTIEATPTSNATPLLLPSVQISSTSSMTTSPVNSSTSKVTMVTDNSPSALDMALVSSFTSSDSSHIIISDILRCESLPAATELVYETQPDSSTSHNRMSICFEDENDDDSKEISQTYKSQVPSGLASPPSHEANCEATGSRSDDLVIQLPGEIAVNNHLGAVMLAVLTDGVSSSSEV